MVTAFPHDITPDALSQTRQFVRTNADLVAHHIEGVPWAGALKNEPFPNTLVKDRETKRSMVPLGAKVYLAVSPGRGTALTPPHACPLSLVTLHYFDE